MFGSVRNCLGNLGRDLNRRFSLIRISKIRTEVAETVLNNWRNTTRSTANFDLKPCAVLIKNVNNSFTNHVHPIRPFNSQQVNGEFMNYFTIKFVTFKLQAINCE